MKKSLKITGFVLVFCCCFLKVQALELYSVIHPGCQRVTGLIVNVDTENVFILNTEGELVRLEQEGIEHILVFNTLDNPVRQLVLSPALKEYARQVKVQGNHDNDFIGWPIRFLENLIMFYDMEGKTHLVDVELIQGFALPNLVLTGTNPIERYKQYRFGFGNNLPECDSQQVTAPDTIQPTRMISDRISIAKFLRLYREGFTRLDRFQKRTSFYARPYLYEKKTKVGIVVKRDDFQEELPGLMPLNFQWPTGSNYGPQGILNLGSNANLNLPNVEPVFAVDFAGKYHFLTVQFSGNVWAFSYGESYIVKNRALFKDFFSKREADDLLVFPQYNQLALTGLEWGPYSFSGGFYYPLIGIQANGIFREVLSEQSMPIVSLKYTTPATRLQLLLSNITLMTNSPSADTISLIYAEEMAQSTAMTQASKDLIKGLDDFRLDSQFLRFNLDLDLNQELAIGFSEVLLLGAYEESRAGSDYTLNYQQYITSLRLQQEFGDYVSLKGYLNYFIRRYQSQSADHDQNIEENSVSFAVVVEFIL